MIRYDVTRERLVEVVDGYRPATRTREKWTARAAAITARCRKQKAFSGEEIWGEIKRVFMDLQRFKCAYCETPLPQSETANVCWDVEHYRPKNAVQPWPTKAIREARGIAYPVKAGRTKGYYLLAHELMNYAASCKECNSPLKGNFFPIGGKADGGATVKLEALNAREQPLLVYPIGGLDEDPEDLLTFAGTVAIPVHASGPLARRAQVCIDFFNLNGRGDLLRGRALSIKSLWPELEADRAAAGGDATAREMIAALTSPRAPFAGCARAFRKTHGADRGKAKAYYEEARRLLTSSEPSLFP